MGAGRVRRRRRLLTARERVFLPWRPATAAKRRQFDGPRRLPGLSCLPLQQVDLQWVSRSQLLLWLFSLLPVLVRLASVSLLLLLLAPLLAAAHTRSSAGGGRDMLAAAGWRSWSRGILRATWR